VKLFKAEKKIFTDLYLENVKPTKTI
jgi:hypothetical protein